MSFKRYYASLLARGLGAPTADEARQDFRNAVALAAWAGSF